MSPKSIYRTAEGEAEIHAIYDQQVERLGIACESRMVDSRLGATHVLVLGPEGGAPMVLLQGGNTTSPLTLHWLRPLAEKYRVYAPDTVGHPGKSAPVRLSPRDSSYGQWLVDVLDGLGLEQPTLVGGSYGAGVLLRAAVHAPHRIGAAVLLIPSGLVSIPFGTMADLVWNLALYRLAPSPARLLRLLRPMFEDEPIGEELVEVSEAVFRLTRIESKMPRNVTREELKDFTAPVMVIAAERDALFPATSVLGRAREVFPNLVAAEVIPEATHYLARRYHPDLNERIDTFLQQVMG